MKPSPHSPQRALIYTRVSQDRNRGRSVAEQEQECRVECADHGWDVAFVLSDSASASRIARQKKVSRPSWDRATALIAAGEVDVFVTWESSRALRDMTTLVPFLDLLEEKGVRWHCSGRTFDPRHPQDRGQLLSEGVQNELEANMTKRRIDRNMSSSARAGRPHGRRLFGYQSKFDPDTGDVLRVEHPEEAAIVRRIFDEYLSGRGLRTIARGLNDAGLVPEKRKPWIDGQVKRVLTNPAYIAKRRHHGVVVADGNWPPLVEQEVFDRVQARIAMVGEKVIRGRPTAHLLTGVARCGVCGAKMAVGHDRRKRKYYQCRGNQLRNDEQRFCVSRDLAKLEAHVTGELLKRLSEPDVAEAVSAEHPDPEMDLLRSQIAELRRRREEITAAFSDPTKDFPLDAFLAADAALRDEVSTLERRLRKASVPIDIDLPDHDIETWWSSLEPEQKRAVVAAVIPLVEVHRAVTGQRTFDPQYVRLHFAGSTASAPTMA